MHDKKSSIIITKSNENSTIHILDETKVDCSQKVCQAKVSSDVDTLLNLNVNSSNSNTIDDPKIADNISAPEIDISITTKSLPIIVKSILKESNNSLETPSTSNAALKTGTDSIDSNGQSKNLLSLAPVSNYYCNRRSWITTDRMNELRRKAQEAVKQNKTFTIRGCFNSVRNALITRGWVEKLDLHRKHIPTGICQVTYDDLAQGLPKRKAGETRRQYIAKCERNIMSRFLEHMPIDFLWTNRKEKCDYIDQAKNPGMTINKFHRAPFTSKEGLCAQLKDFHWFYEEGTAEMYFPRCFNVWSPEELCEFIENYKQTACIAFIRSMVDHYRLGGFDAVFSPFGKIPFNSIDFAFKRCNEYIENSQHNDIDVEDPPKIWEHDWDAFLYQQYHMTTEGGKILADPQRIVEHIIKAAAQLLENLQFYWPQYSLDGYQNLWIIKPANKCRGRGIQLMDNLKKILNVINPAITSKSRYVVQKYIERPLIIHHTKFDIRQWFLITNVQPLVVWMYKESYLRFSSQEYSLTNHHESVHLTNHAIQKKYTNGKRDKRLPTENMWDCYSFQAYLRQIGKQDMWLERIYPGMRKAIIGTMLASQDNMDRRPNTFELFGADFMICENFYPWLIEINSSPDLGATTSVTARMCPQCLEDVIKVVIDRRTDPKSDMGNFELIYRQIIPPTPAYMGLNLFVKGKQMITKVHHSHTGYHHHQYNHHHDRRHYSNNLRKERSLHTSHFFHHRVSLVPTVSNVHKVMPTFNATDLLEKCLTDSATINSHRSNGSGAGSSLLTTGQTVSHQLSPLGSARSKMAAICSTTPLLCPNLLRTPQTKMGIRRRSFTNLSSAHNSNGVKSLSDGVQPLGGNSAETAVAVTPPKRYRSCGPSLAAASSMLKPADEKRFKFIIKKCTTESDAKKYVVQNNENLFVKNDGTTLNKFKRSTSRSEDNIVERLRKNNVLVQQSPPAQAKSLVAPSITTSNSAEAAATVSYNASTTMTSTALRSQSCLVALRKTSVYRRLHAKQDNVTAEAATKTSSPTTTTATTRTASGKTNMRAIGKGITTKRSSSCSSNVVRRTTVPLKSNSLTTTTAAVAATAPQPPTMTTSALTSKSASVYVCRNAPPQVHHAASQPELTTVLAASRLKRHHHLVISPRHRSRRRLSNSERRRAFNVKC